jgi:uncharacterized protein (DUF924 family)
MSNDAPADIITFWRAAGREKWFGENEEFDSEIRSRFFATYERAGRSELTAWERDPQGALALLLLLDQFPRNMFRGDAHAFATDPLARRVAKEAITQGFDKVADASVRLFFYLPLMHSEMVEDQDQSLQSFEALGDADQLRSAIIHRDAIRRFGRFPHRNRVLDRVMTPDEQNYLDGGGFAG